MLHVAYWTDLESKKLLTLLGSMPGKAAPMHGTENTNFEAAQKTAKDEAEAAAIANGKAPKEVKKAGKSAKVTQSARSCVCIRLRQGWLKEVDLVADSEDQLVNKDGN